MGLSLSRGSAERIFGGQSPARSRNSGFVIEEQSRAPRGGRAAVTLWRPVGPAELSLVRASGVAGLAASAAGSADLLSGVE